MLKIENLKVTFDNFQLNCSLSIQPGQITGIIGSNGAGKTTLFNSILGLLPNIEGNILLFNKNIQNITSHDKEKIGVILSDSTFSGYLNINDIEKILKNMYSHFDSIFFSEKINQYNLPKKQAIKNFSTGMIARLKFIIALSHNAQFLILDEPTSGLDILARNDLLDLLRDYMTLHENCSILISSHISNDLETLCDDIYLINQGSILLHEDTDLILSQYALLKVTIEQFVTLDKTYLLKYQKEPFGYTCLTSQKQFYQENYPSIVIENATIDTLLPLMIKGENLS